MNPNHPRRGEIYEGDSAKAGMDKNRPLLIIQNDFGNKYSHYTIIVPIHHEKMKPLPVMVSVPKGIVRVLRKTPLLIVDTLPAC